MRFWVHVAIAFIAAFTAVAALQSLGASGFANAFNDAALLAQIAGVTLLGAALPDVDLPKTKQFRIVAAVVAVAAFAVARDFFSRRFPQATQVETAAAGVVCAIAALGVAYIAKPRHRGVTHSFAALACFAIAIFLLTQSVLLAGFAALAFATHLACDFEFKLV
jgi:membrane-bound metal-dependent hydrolase YbcI (DUF457 family)